MNLYQIFATSLTATSGGGVSPGILGLLNLNGHSSLCNFELHNTGSAPLTGFRMQFQDHPDGEWYDKYSSQEDWISTAIGDKRFISGDPTVLAAGQRIHVHTRLSATWDFRFYATCNTSTSLVVRGGLFFGGV